ncbi:MAG: transcription-repair coupling factor [Thermodesulfobacteriota bacterium]|nr:transcription-repair coupling factor [Thermodesulfobacteriota bacterium]
MIFPEILQNFLQGENKTVRIFKSGPGTWSAAAQGLLAQGSSVVVIVPGAKELASVTGLMDLLSPNQDPLFWRRSWAAFPSYPAGSLEPGGWAGRWAALYALAQARKPQGIVLSLDNLLPLWPPPGILDTLHLSLRKGEEVSPQDIIEQAVTWGYVRMNMVTAPGEIALRGDILDVFAPGFDQPLRLEFFGNTCEDIRLFDPATQRSKQELSEAVLLPISPGVPTPKLKSQAVKKWNKLQGLGEIPRAALESLKRRLDGEDQNFRPGDFQPGLFYEKPSTLKDWLPRDTVYLLCGAGRLRSGLEETEWAWNDYLAEEAKKDVWRRPKNVFVQAREAAERTWKEERGLFFEDLVIGGEKDGFDLPEKSFRSFGDLFWKPEQAKRPWQALMESLKSWKRSRPQIVLSFFSERSRNKFLALAAQEDVYPETVYSPDKKGLFALVSPFAKGIELVWNKSLILSEDILQPRPTARRAPDKAFLGLSGHADLTPGDLLVHRDFGLARFEGLERLKIGPVANDYLLLRYAGDDRLYIPVDRLNLIQRFKGPEGAVPVLDRLGGSSWKKAKAKAKKAIEKIARELVEMYAFRKVAKGYAYGPIDSLYREFEAGFGFEETQDQEQALRDVFRDMEQPEPMDRLVCGDVGFGKTEVAMRAAFRAAVEGKQTAILCPTTVLAEQHYQNFKRRLENFPISVAMLSRFVPRKQQQAIVRAASQGQIDVLIGTHRLLSKDVSLPNMGLLILDEEQRFGVKNKEKIKLLKKNIDVMALTATPIPRTLQLSLSGIRGLSVIETPPQDRKPVETRLIERDQAVLKGIVVRELERQGQVFWVHNRVRDLERVVEFVRSLAPEARVDMAHGQMPERLLEEAMHKFWHHELDILVCTAIIEAGLDFPRANTLIVDQAQLFGLGQLYQLRGRVGRSERQAYAYFVIPSLESVPEISRKRLKVILDMDFLGAGFQVAMEDLRLRGAGNILGEVQSGSIAKVGLDMFLEMLNQEVRRLKGEERIQETSPELNILFDARIPESYVPDSFDRLRYYKALSSADDPGAVDELVAEMRDLFGAVPEQTLLFIAVLRLKRLLARLQVIKADLYPNRMVLNWSDRPAAVSPEKIISWVRDRADWAKLTPPAKLLLRIRAKESIREGILFCEKELTELLDLENVPETSQPLLVHE